MACKNNCYTLAYRIAGLLLILKPTMSVLHRNVMLRGIYFLLFLSLKVVYTNISSPTQNQT